VELAPGRYRLQGRVDLGSIPAVVKQGLPVFGPQRRRSRPLPPRIEIDLGGVERASSAAVALLLEWTDQAAQNRIELAFLNWPPALMRIADFSNVAGLLGIHKADQNASPAWTNS
jgi:phospholipid transport system transporter-binding protein